MPEAVLEDLEEIRHGARRAARLTRQLLLFSRKDVGESRNVNVNRLVEQMRSMLRRLIPEDLELVTELSPDVPAVHTDPTQMEQVLLNLVVNARDAMADVRGTISVRTAYLPEGHDDGSNESPELAEGPCVLVEVEDEGEGMSEEVRARIFEPFFTTKERGRGTGLGLATSYGIVRRSGGHIRAVSELGEGSTFQILLPVSAIAEDEGRVDEEPDPRRDLGQQEGVVLLVEDEEDVRRVVARLLERAGYTVLAADSGEEALRLVGEDDTEVDLLLTDLVMRGRSGPEVAADVKEADPRIRVLYMSGYADEDVMVDGKLPFGGDLLSKPIEPKTLISRVARAIARREA